MAEDREKLLDDSFGLNIWWNLHILRDALRKVRQLVNPIRWSPAGVSRAYALSLSRRSGGGPRSGPVQGHSPEARIEWLYFTGWIRPHPSYFSYCWTHIITETWL